jgi:hypothetical protein
LDSQSVNEPKHWREDDPHNGVRAWLVGQAVALREAMWALNRESAATDEVKAQGSALGWLLMRTTQADPSLPQISSGILKVINATQQAADELARSAADWNPTNDAAMSILQTLAASDSEFQPTNASGENLFYRALRLTLAIDRLSAALNLSPKIDKELSALRADVQRNYDFDAAAFAGHLRALRAKL